MRSISFTMTVNARSHRTVITSAISSGDTPLYVQMALTTGMLISGKMSVGMR